MAEYYPIIARAVAGVESGETRRSMYDRARTAQLAGLRKHQPNLSESEITRERAALEEAIRRVESEAADRSVGRTQANPSGSGTSADQQSLGRTVTAEAKNSRRPEQARPARPSDSNSKEALSASGFSLLSNPFVLLRVTPYSTAQEIKEAYEDAIEDGLAPADVLQRAQQSLLTPKLRIDAEVGGFLDVRPELAVHVIAKLEAGARRVELDDELGSLHALPKANVLAHLGSRSSLSVAELLQLLEAQATIAVGGVYEAVIEAREQAGAGKVDRDVVAEALGRLEERQAKGVINALAGKNALAETFAAFVNRVLIQGDPSLIGKLDLYIRAYGHAAAPELSRRREKVVTACDALRSDPTKNGAIEQIASELRRWNEIGQPLQQFESHMHREDAQARELYLHVRELCIWLANEKEQYETAQKITRACADVFKELPRAIGQMKEEGDLLSQLHTQQTAATLFEPLANACEEAQKNHRRLEQELLRSGFGPGSKGLVKTLYDRFSEAVRNAAATEFADLPWYLVRNIAISLNNDSRSPRAAAVLMNGLVAFFGTRRPSPEAVEILEKDQRASRKNVIQADLERSLSGGELTAAASLVYQLLALETDPNEIAALQKMQAVISERRHARNIKIGLGIAAAAAVVLLLVISSGDNRSVVSSPSTYRPPPDWQTTVRPSPDRQTTVAATEERPPIGTGLSFSRGNIRYCQFQDVRLDAMRAVAIDRTDVAAFNSLVNDWNSRCSNYRYRASDKNAVDTEVAARRATLEAEGRALVAPWRSR